MPPNETYTRSFYVPDLSPRERQALKKTRPRFLFVAESPHKNEVEPKDLMERRPLCGAAGRQWWSLVGELLEKDASQDVSLERLLKLCSRHRMAVMNAVQFPLDTKITRFYPAADPVKNLGFAKTTGEKSYKKRSKEVLEAIASLRERLTDPSVADVPVVLLGNDAEWFVSQALGKEEAALRIYEKVPHPSAWWRAGGLFGRIAREKLGKILGT